MNPTKAAIEYNGSGGWPEPMATPNIKAVIDTVWTPETGSVFVSRRSDRGEPDNATAADWADAQAIIDAIGAWRGPPGASVKK